MAIKGMLVGKYAQCGEHAGQQLYLSYACGTASANHACLARATLGDGRLEQVEEIFRVHPAKRGDAHYGGAWHGCRMTR
nr:PQQ-dependent sugar dehydrogenase [Halomonas sp. 141]